MSVTVGDIERTLFDHFPHEWAESWDRVGIIAGDPAAEVERVLVTLDPTHSAVLRARDMGASALVTHHPATLAPVERLRPGTDAAGVLFEAVRAGIALIAAHTNLDRAPEGVAALPALLDLVPAGIVERSRQPMTRVTVYVPPEAADGVVAAMAAAGAGRIGAYEQCAFTAGGHGEFVPRSGAHPRTGELGHRSRVEEQRVEMLCARASETAVTDAARRAHPYDQPLIVSEDVEIARSGAGLGMRCVVEGGTSVALLAARVAERLGSKPRVWGDAARPLQQVVTATGSATSLLGDVRASGADALVCGEVRYHDALSAAEAGLAIIECGHDVSEWPLTIPLADAVRSTAAMHPESVIVEKSSAAWWTA